jgi:hypothetical protein
MRKRNPQEVLPRRVSLAFGQDIKERYGAPEEIAFNGGRWQFLLLLVR